VRGAVRILAALAPLLRVLGVKKKTVAGKAGEVAKVLDETLPRNSKP